MAISPTTSALNKALEDCRAQYTRTVENAERILENRRNEHRRLISESEDRVAGLESQLETFEALEHDRLAAQTRKELATAIEDHKQVVDRADRMLTEWARDHARALAAAGIALEASMNAALARLPAQS